MLGAKHSERTSEDMCDGGRNSIDKSNTPMNKTSDLLAKNQFRNINADVDPKRSSSQKK